MLCSFQWLITCDEFLVITVWEGMLHQGIEGCPGGSCITQKKPAVNMSSNWCLLQRGDLVLHIVHTPVLNPIIVRGGQWRFLSSTQCKAAVCICMYARIEDEGCRKLLNSAPCIPKDTASSCFHVQSYFRTQEPVSITWGKCQCTLHNTLSVADL